MAVYERKYRTYDGDLTEKWNRFLVLPRYAYEQVFQSKLFVVFMALSALPSLIGAILIYIPNNERVLEFLDAVGMREVAMQALGNYGPNFFIILFGIQATFALTLTFIMGPALVSADLRNNGLPLYLSRPFSRAEYVLGKSAVLAILISLVTWIPGVGLFGLQAIFGGPDWIRDNLRIPFAILVSSGVWMSMCTLSALAISAYVKWKPVARLMMIILFIVFPLFTALVNELLQTRLATFLSLTQLMDIVFDWIFGVTIPRDSLSPFWAIAGVVGYALLFLWVLNRKLRAYEVVS